MQRTLILFVAVTAACTEPSPTAAGTKLLHYDVAATLAPDLGTRLRASVPLPHDVTVGAGEKDVKAAVHVRFTTAIDATTGDAHVVLVDADVTKNNGCNLALHVVGRASSLPIRTADGHKAWPTELALSYDCSALLFPDRASGVPIVLYGDGTERDYAP